MPSGRRADYLAGDIRDRGLYGNPVLLTGLACIVSNPVYDQVDAHNHHHIAHESEVGE